MQIAIVSTPFQGIWYNYPIVNKYYAIYGARALVPSRNCLQTPTLTRSRAGMAIYCLTSANRHLIDIQATTSLFSDPTSSTVVIWVKIFKTGKTIEIHLVRLTEVCGKVLHEKYAYKSVKTALLLSNGTDVDHQNSCLFTNKRHFSSPLWVLIGVLAKFHK